MNISQTQIEHCKAVSKRIRRHIVDMAFSTGKIGTHIGGSLSMVELLAGLYAGNVQYKADNPNWEYRDRVILSKGHAAMALYPAMVEAGIIDEFLLKTFKKDGSKLSGHPSLNGLPGIEFASGSLGQGLSLAVGMSLSLKMKKNEKSRIFVFIGDGECDEGSIWEAAASASHYELNNIIAIVDVNNMQYDGFTSEIMDMTSLESKWESFGWYTIAIDGHNMEEILNAYNTHVKGKPIVILARTIKGKGVSYMENNRDFHNAILSKRQYEQAIDELGNVI